MEFPDAERVIYSRNPLAEVACQFRFPRILALDERIPAEFQTNLGLEYPFVETREVVQFTFQVGGDAPVKRIQYDFSTEDRAYTVTLSSEFIGVTTRSYQRWELFSKHLGRALDALIKTYSVSLFTRVGLRYVDVITRSELGLEGVRWSDLIRSSALGLLAEKEVPIDSVADLNAVTVVKLDGGGKATIRTALSQAETPSSETVFIVDSDFYQDEPMKGSADAVALCSRFNRSAGRAFRWIIHDQLHDALQPRAPA